MFKKILVATDGSSHAQSAIDVASDLAEKYGAELVLLHVLQRNVSDSLRHMAEVEYGANLGVGGSARSEAALYEAVTDIGRRILERGRDIARDKGLTAVRMLTTEGDAAHQIIDTAGDEGADLIVMGSRGLSDLKGLLMGSVSHKVSQLAKCTCITVK